MEIDWKLDEDGDWRLYVNGDYFGMVCPHEERFTCPIAVWDGEQHHCADTVDEAKQILVNMAYQSVYENEFDNRQYPVCC